MATRFGPVRGSAILGAIARGPTGAAATATVGTTTTGAAGSSASVANSGSTSAVIFDFTIPRGADAGFKYTFDTSTDTSTTPSSGGLRFNNATPASITEIAISATDADGNTARPTILTYDDSSSTAKGTIAFKRYDGRTIILNIAGSFTDNTTWLKLTVTHSSGTSLFAASDKIYLTERVTGDTGTGNVNATSTFGTDNCLIRSDGTSRNIQASGITVDDSDNVSGVVALSVTTINLGNADTTLSRSAAGVLAVEGVDVALNSTSAVHTAGTIELGAASDTTLSRVSAGNIAVEGNAIYRAGGTDVPVTDGGTGGSDATTARTNLGLAIGTNVQAYEAQLSSLIRQNSKSAAYTTVLGDGGYHIFHPAADNNARTFTIDSNSNVAYPIGTAITFVNEINTVTISITSDTLTLSPGGTTGSRTLAANGMATAIKVTSTKWMISGTGLT